jgi:hypothetical protein
MVHFVVSALMGYAGDDYCGTPHPRRFGPGRYILEILVAAVSGIVVSSVVNLIAPDSGLTVSALTAFAGGKLGGVVFNSFSPVNEVVAK